MRGLLVTVVLALILVATRAAPNKAEENSLLCTLCERVFVGVLGQLQNVSKSGVELALYTVCSNFKMTLFCTTYLDPYINTIFDAIKNNKPVCVALSLCANAPVITAGDVVLASLDNLNVLSPTSAYGRGALLAALNSKEKMPSGTTSTSIRGIDCRGTFCVVLVSDLIADSNWVLVAINNANVVQVQALPLRSNHATDNHHFVGPWYNPATDKFVVALALGRSTMDKSVTYYEYAPGTGELQTTFTLRADWAIPYDAVLWNGWLVFTNEQYATVVPRIYVLDLQSKVIISNFTSNARSGLPVHLCQDIITNKIYATQYDVFSLDVTNTFSSTKISTTLFSSQLDDCAVDPVNKALIGHSVTSWYNFRLDTRSTNEVRSSYALSGKVAFRARP